MSRSVVHADIMQVVCAEYKVAPDDLYSNRRQVDLVHAREAYVWLARILRTYPYPEIAQHLKRDGSAKRATHTTAIAQFYRATKKYAHAPWIKEKYNRMALECERLAGMPMEQTRPAPTPPPPAPSA